MGNKSNPMYNSSGCADPTVYEALKPIIKEDAAIEKKSHELIKVMKGMAALSGFELIERIQIRHKKSGKEFK